MLERIRNNPAMLAAIVSAVLAVGTTFGLGLTVEQTGAILALVNIVAGLIVRAQVKPTRTIDVEPVSVRTIIDALADGALTPNDVRAAAERHEAGTVSAVTAVMVVVAVLVGIVCLQYLGWIHV